MHFSRMSAAHLRIVPGEGEGGYCDQVPGYNTPFLAKPPRKYYTMTDVWKNITFAHLAMRAVNIQ